ncbi:MAG: hypothetical protein ABI776_07625 [Nocardioidaceae bacterium]
MRPGTTIGDLAALRPLRLDLDPESTVTAGNASGQNDGAAMCVVTTIEEAERCGPEPASGRSQPPRPHSSA